MRIVFPAVVLFLLVWGSLSGQSLQDQQYTDRLNPGLTDPSGVLGKGSEAQKRVAAMLKDLERERGYRVFVVIERSLISSNAIDMAAQLQQTLLPNGGGLVVVYESDTRMMGFGRSLDPGEGMVADTIGVPSYELYTIIIDSLRAAEKNEKAKEADVYLDVTVTELCKNIEAYFVRKEAPVEGSRSLRMALVTVGALSLLALCCMGLGVLSGRSARRRAEIKVFPLIDIPERLGAPYGGSGGRSASFGHGCK